MLSISWSRHGITVLTILFILSNKILKKKRQKSLAFEKIGGV